MGVYRPKYRAKNGHERVSNIWWIDYYVGRRRVRESSHSTIKREAKALLAQRQAEASRGVAIIPRRSLTLADLAKALLDDYRVQGHRSLVRAELSCRRLCAALGDLHPREITASVMSGYTVHRLDQGAAPASINRELSALGRMYTLAMQSGVVARRPHMQKLREDNVRTGFFEREQVDAVIAELPPHLQPVIVVAYITGWRIKSELLTRQWQHVDFEHGWLRLEPGEAKNREGRNFPFADIPELRYALEEQRRVTEAFQIRTASIVPWVFHREGQPIRDFYTAWRGACRRAGVPGRLPHDLRRSAIRNLERAGIPRSAAMKMVGHQTESVYRRYAIADEGLLLESAKKLGEMHKSEKVVKVWSKSSQNSSPKRKSRGRK